MPRQSVFDMPFSKVYPLLIAKVERKGRTREEMDALTVWLTGYTVSEIDRALTSSVTYGAFFSAAPGVHENAAKVRGTVCGVRVETIEDPLMHGIRALDRLADELAKGKTPDRILEKYR